jgi:hypothetical protein
MVMVREKYGVKLAPEERERLEGLVRSGKSPARVMARARILLKTGEGWKAPKVAEALDVSEGTVFRIKRRFAEEGLEGCCGTGPSPAGPGSWMTGARRTWSPPGRGRRQALACSPAPEGRGHWTLRLLAGKVVELGLASSMSHEGVRKRLKKTPSNRGRRRSGASPR